MPEDYQLREELDLILRHQRFEKEQRILQTEMIRELVDFIKGTDMNGYKGMRSQVNDHEKYIEDRKIQDALIVEDMKRVRYFANVIAVGFIGTIIAFITSKK